MKSKNSLLFLLILLLSVLPLCACWNYTDIEKVLITTGFSIDKQEDTYLITIEIIDFEMSGTAAKQSARYVESQGKTVFDALRNAINIIGKKIYWAHAAVVVISQDIAKEGIIQTIDLICRDAEIREAIYVLISAEKTAKEVLLQDMLLSQTSTNNFEQILSNQKSLGKTVSVHAYELVKDIENSGISPILPAIQIVKILDKNTAKVAGTALFKSDKLVGFIDPEESKYLLFVKNEIQGGLILLNMDSKNKTDDISIEILDSKTKVKPIYTDGKLTMSISIKTDVAIGEAALYEKGAMDLTKAINYEKIEKSAEKQLKASVEGIIKKVQSDFGTDVFGFGRLVRANKPSVWKKIDRKWDEIFKELAFTVNVDMTIRNTALAKKTIKKGD